MVFVSDTLAVMDTDGVNVLESVSGLSFKKTEKKKVDKKSYRVKRVKYLTTWAERRNRCKVLSSTKSLSNVIAFACPPPLSTSTKMIN